MTARMNGRKSSSFRIHWKRNLGQEFSESFTMTGLSLPFQVVCGSQILTVVIKIRMFVALGLINLDFSGIDFLFSNWLTRALDGIIYPFT